MRNPLNFLSKDLTYVVALFFFTDEDHQEGQQGASSSDPMSSLYSDILCERKPQVSPQEPERNPAGASRFSISETASNQNSQKDNNQEASKYQSELEGEKSSSSSQLESESTEQQDEPGKPQLAAPVKIHISQPIGSLCGAVKVGSGAPLTVRGEIETVSDEEILKNRESEEGIRSVPRFRNYQPGTPSKVSTAALSSHEINDMMYTT